MTEAWAWAAEAEAASTDHSNTTEEATITVEVATKTEWVAVVDTRIGWEAIRIGAFSKVGFRIGEVVMMEQVSTAAGGSPPRTWAKYHHH